MPAINKDNQDLAVEIAKIKTLLEEVVVPGIKKSGLKWDENDALNLPEAIKSLNVFVKKITVLESEHEKLKKHVLERIKLCFILTFILFSLCFKSVSGHLYKAFKISSILN